MTKGEVLGIKAWMLAVLLLLSLPAMAQDRGDEIVRSGMALPDFSVVTKNGQEVSNASLLGRPSVIVFFNTACFDCRRKLPLLQKAYAEYADRVAFLCIARKDSADAVSRFWEENNLSLPVAPQNDKAVYTLFARRTIPRIYIADKNGIVQSVFVEKVSLRKLKKALQQVLDR